MNYWICWVHAQRCRGAAPQAVVSHVCGIWSANCMEPGLACGLAVCAGSLQAQQSMQSSSNLKHCTPQNKTRKRKKWKRKKKYNLLLYKYKNFFPKRSCPDDQRVRQGSRWCISVLEMAGILKDLLSLMCHFSSSPRQFSVAVTIPALMYGPADVSVVLFIHLPFWWNSSYFPWSLPFSFLI